MGDLAFGIVPHVNDEATRTHLADFCRLLSAATQTEIRGHRFPSPSLLAAAFGARKVSLAWVSPGLLVLSPHLATAVPLVSMVRQGQAAYHSILFSLASGPIRDTAALRGTRVAWVAPTSAAGYAFPRLALRLRGLVPERLFAQESYLGTYGAVATAVATGAADVGASFATFEDGDPSRAVRSASFHEIAGAPPMRILLTCGPIPADPIAAAVQISFADRSRIRDALLRTAADPSASPALHGLFNADSFAPTDPDELDTIRRRLSPQG